MKWIKKYNKFARINESVEIDSLCQKYGITNYTINQDGSIDVEGKVDLNNLGLDRIPLKFGRVNGGFSCENNQIVSLEGCPSYVGGNFYCRHNQIKNLVGGPEVVTGIYMAAFNQIESLAGSPREVGAVFTVSRNKLTNLIGCPVGLKNYEFGDNELVSLEGSPEVVNGSFNVSHNKLESLKGGPREVTEYFGCHYNQLKSLKDGPEEVQKTYWANNNQLTDLYGGPRSCKDFICSNNNLTSLKGDVKYVEDLFLFTGNQVTIIDYEDIEFLECTQFIAGEEFGKPKNLITNIITLFKDFKDFKYSLEYNYLSPPNIINRERFSQACQEFEIEMPESIDGYVFE